MTSGMNTMDTMQGGLDALVIGAGMSGLSAAFHLARRGLAVEVVDPMAKAGGVIGSVTRDGMLYETGPNSALDTSPRIGEICEAAGVGGERRFASEIANTRYVVKGGRPVPLPMSPGAFLSTPLFSFGAKARLALEPFIGRQPEGDEETIAHFVRRRLGVEFLDYAIEPFVAGIYAGDPERLSVPAAFPKLHALERKWGSLLKGQFLGARERAKRNETAKNTANSFSFAGGMQVLTDALARGAGTVRTGVRAVGLSRLPDGTYIATLEHDGARFTRHARAVIVATPAGEAAALVAALDPDAAQALGRIEYPAVTVVASAYRREDVAHPLDGFGLLAPRKENRALLGTLFTSSMFDGRAKPGTVLLTTFVGGRRNPALAMADDATVAETVYGEHAALLGAKARPQWNAITRWPRAIPQYELGHLERLAVVAAAEARLPGLKFCANYRGGVSVGDCLVNGATTGEAVAAWLGAPVTS